MKFKRIIGFVVAFVSAFVMVQSTSLAQTPTGVEKTVYAMGSYSNWDGVTNVAQFAGPDGNLYFAVDSDSVVKVYKTKDGAVVGDTVTLTKPHPQFGTVICDGDGNYYLVTGETNNDDSSTNTETIFISKFDSAGGLIRTVGESGSGYSGGTWNTKQPFRAGNCDAAISNDILLVFYGRQMYNGHQSCDVFAVKLSDLSSIDDYYLNGAIYQSHSFAQRVVPTDSGFVLASEGDAYSRGFVIYNVDVPKKETKGDLVFNFWVKEGALDEYNMSIVNYNYAKMGGLALLPSGNVAFAGQSVKSLSSAANEEAENIFIQIMAKGGDLNSASGYITSGTRSGLGGSNGRDNVTDYGVKWLTSYEKGATVDNVQIAAAGDKIVVLYELYQNYKSTGVYYIILDQAGNVKEGPSLYSADAKLNPCETPVSKGGKVYWVGNKNTYGDNQVYLYTLDLAGAPDYAEGKHLEWGYSNGKSYWYENGRKQGTYDDPKGVIGDGTVRGREIYDPATGAWYWLDSCYNGAKAIGKEVWMPYVFQDEDKWDDAKIRKAADSCDEGMRDLVYYTIKNHKGKWVRYDENGKMLKGWVTIEGALAEKYPDQAGNTYYYDNITGLMARGEITLDGVTYHFNETTGVRE